MINLNNKRVKLFLKSGLNCEGSVISHTQEEIILSNSGNNNLMVINNPDHNVEAYLIFDLSEQMVEPLPDIVPFKLPPVDIASIPEPERYTDLNISNLAALKKEKNKMYVNRLKKEINKVHLNDSEMNNYSLPPIFFNSKDNE